MRVIIREAWLVVAGTLAWFGIMSGSTALILIASMVFGAGSLSRLWARLSLDRVQYDRRLSDHRVFVGEEVGVVHGVQLEALLGVHRLCTRSRRSPHPHPRTLMRSIGARARETH